MKLLTRLLRYWRVRQARKRNLRLYKEMMERKNIEQRKNDLEVFRQYLRRVNDDPVRQAELQQFLEDDAIRPYDCVTEYCDPHPPKLVFKIDTTGMNPDKALEVAEKLRKTLYKKPIVDPKTGEIEFPYNQIPIEQDFYM